MDPANEFLPYAAGDAVFALEPRVRKALSGRPAEFARAAGAALAWEYSGNLTWIVEQPDASFTIVNGKFVPRGIPESAGEEEEPSQPVEAESERGACRHYRRIPATLQNL